MPLWDTLGKARVLSPIPRPVPSSWAPAVTGLQQHLCLSLKQGQTSSLWCCGAQSEMWQRDTKPVISAWVQGLPLHAGLWRGSSISTFAPQFQGSPAICSATNWDFWGNFSKIRSISFCCFEFCQREWFIQHRTPWSFISIWWSNIFLIINLR